MRRKMISVITVFLFVCFLNIWLPPPMSVNAANDTYSPTWYVKFVTPGGTVKATIKTTFVGGTSGSYTKDPYISEISYGGSSKDYISNVKIGKYLDKAQVGTNDDGSKGSTHCISCFYLTFNQRYCTNLDRGTATDNGNGGRFNAHKYLAHNKDEDGAGANYERISSTTTNKVYFQANKSRSGCTLSLNVKESHSFTSKTVNNTYLRSNATCTAAATYFYKCSGSGCSEKGSTYYNSGSALGHSSNNVWVTTKNATCLEDGSKHTNCSRCKVEINVTAIPKLGHSFTSQTVNSTYLRSNATCTASATYFYKCSRCSAKGTTFYNSGSALGHNSNNVWITTKDATCLEDGSKHTNCSRCSAEMNVTVIPKLGHSASAKLVSAATCTTAAVYHDTCNRCGVETRGNYYSGNALGHSFTSQTVNSTYLRSNATCTAPATYFYKCSRCSAKGTTFYNYGSALGHSNNNVWVTTKEPTCLEDGSKHTNCTRCGSDMNVTAIPKLGHVDNGVWVTETESTCTGTGSKHTNCARCNAVLNETVLDALGHVWDSGIITTAPTVYRTGIRTFTCQTCHDTVTEIEPQYQFTIFAGTKRVRKIAKGTSILFENTTNTDDRLPFIVSTGIATHE